MTPIQRRINATLGAFATRGISCLDYRNRPEVQALRDHCMLEWGVFEMLERLCDAARAHANAGYVVVDESAPRCAKLEVI